MKYLQTYKQEVRFRFCLELHFVTLSKTLERVNDESERPAQEMVVSYWVNYATIHLDKESQELQTVIWHSTGGNTVIRITLLYWNY
jgi:hypothetical protein